METSINFIEAYMLTWICDFFSINMYIYIMEILRTYINTSLTAASTTKKVKQPFFFLFKKFQKESTKTHTYTHTQHSLLTVASNPHKHTHTQFMHTYVLLVHTYVNTYERKMHTVHVNWTKKVPNWPKNNRSGTYSLAYIKNSLVLLYSP